VLELLEGRKEGGIAGKSERQEGRYGCGIC
jgi:hypothetical protein